MAGHGKGARAYDIIVYGATGFTGRLVAEHLLATYGVGKGVNWAMAGRSQSKLEEVRAELGGPDTLPLVVADADNAGSLKALAESTSVIITTVGPYQLYGSALVAACAAAGTDYVDLCGEPAWMAEMIGAHEAAAKASGARIVFSCGFDSIPFDLGVWFLQQEAIKRSGKPAARVRGRIRDMLGTFSGGTLASMRATMGAMAQNPAVGAVLANPFALTPGFTGPAQPADNAVVYDEVAKSWVSPFVMATINTKNVHRSNFLLGHQYGQDFAYDEMSLNGDGPEGEAKAKGGGGAAFAAGGKMPAPGEGPSREERDAGHYDVLFIGELADGKTVLASVQGDKDPGYGSTSKMIGEAAMCLLEDVGHDQTPGGIWTTAPAFAGPLIKRLEAKAGLTFKVEG